MTGTSLAVAAGDAANRRDVVILGGGLVGLTLAIGLARTGITSHVVDRAAVDAKLAPALDGRATAIASASWRMLDALGLADRLEPHSQPIRAIRVSDNLRPGELHFRTTADEDPLGIMIPNALLRSALHEAAAADPAIALHHGAEVTGREREANGVFVTLANGVRLQGSLMVAAEGRNSPTRDEAGLRVARWRYDHRAIIATLAHERPHDAVAHEIFYAAGPYAVLPMTDGEDGRHRSALVWTVAERDAAGVLALSPRAFAAEAERRMGSLLGRIELLGDRGSWPLGFHHAGRITASRLALAGDAAHGIHPIAGQGLNLGLRDAAALVEVLADAARLGLDAGDAATLERYERWRGFDSFSVALATDTLTRLYGLPGALPSAVRRFGMAIIDRLPPLKGFLMAEARGEGGKLPRLLRGEPA